MKMKVTHTLLLLFLMLFLILQANFANTHPLEDTNDYIEHAQENTYLTGDANGGSLDDGDWDFWRYEIPNSGLLDIQLNSVIDGDYDWILYGGDATGYDPDPTTIVCESHASGINGDEFLIGINVLPGYYYLKIYSPINSMGSYTFTSNYGASTHPEESSNDYKETANTNTYIDGNENSGSLDNGDWDYWEYDFPENGYLDIELESNTSVDCDWELYDPDSAVIAYSSVVGNGADDNVFSIQVTEGVHYLKIYLHEGSVGTGDYILRSEFTPSQKETRIIDFDNVVTSVGIPVKLEARVQAKTLGIFMDIEDGLTIKFYVDDNLNGFDDDSITGTGTTNGGLASYWYTSSLEGSFPVKAVLSISNDYDPSSADALITVNPLQTVNINIENVSGGATSLQGVWRCEFYNAAMEYSKAIFSSDPENIYTDLPSGEYTVKVFFLFNDGQGIWEFWGQYSFSLTDSNIDLTLVRDRPWLGSILPSSPSISNSETLNLTCQLNNELETTVEVFVEARIGTSTLVSSNPVTITEISNQNVGLLFYNLPDFGKWPLYYCIKSKQLGETEFIITDHGEIQGYLNIEASAGPNSNYLCMDYRDQNNDLWQIGFDYKNPANTEWFYEPKDTFQDLKFYKNGQETQPGFEIFQTLLERVGRQFEPFYPMIIIGDEFDERYGIWRNSCGFSWACGLALTDFDDNERRNYYKDLIWDAITSRNHPYLNQEILVPNETDENFYTSGLPVKLVSYIDDLHAQYQSQTDDIFKAANYIKKIQNLAAAAESDPVLKTKIESESKSLGAVIDCLQVANLAGSILTHTVQDIVLMDYLASTEFSDNRLKSLKSAYNYVRDNIRSDIDPELLTAINEVENELTARIDSIGYNIVNSFLNAAEEDLKNSEFLRNKIIGLATNELAGNIARTIAKNLKMSPKVASTLGATFLSDIASAVYTVRNTGDTWRYIISAGMLSKVVTLYAQNSSDWISYAYPDNAVMTYELLKSSKVRDVYDLQSVFVFEYLSRGLTLVEPNWNSVLQDAVDSTLDQAISPPYAYPINYASTAVSFGSQIGITANNLAYSDSLEAARDMLLSITNSAVKKNQALNDWAEMFGEKAPNIYKTLSHITISGLNQVDEKSNSQYTCIATYDDGSTEDISDQAQWSVDCDSSTIDQNGLLSAGAITVDVPCIITVHFNGEYATYDIIISNILCIYEISPTTVTIESTGGVSSLSVISTDDCTWSTNSNVPWINIISGAIGSGNGTVNFSVESNPDSSMRTGTLAIAGETFTVTQDGVSCDYSISPTSENFDASGHSSSISVTAPSGCTWSSTSNNSWLQITYGNSGTGNGTVNYSVSANTNINSRTGALTIAGETFTVIQSGISCSYVISPSLENFDSNSGNGSFTITTQNECSWTATCNESWISVTSNSSGSGDATIDFSILSNTDTNQRTGTINIGDQVFTINQEGIICDNYDISPASKNFGSAGGVGTISLTVSDGCTWNASSDVSWISITSGQDGSGNGTIIYSVSENATASQRTGIISIADQTFTVTQLEAASDYHSGDYNPADWAISEDELQQIIELYQAGSYHCNPASDSGYSPGSGSQTCSHHSSDYNPADWQISQSELLRAIQIYNVGLYHQDPSDEDGFSVKDN